MSRVVWMYSMFLDLFCEYFLRFNLVFMSLPLIKEVFIQKNIRMPHVGECGTPLLDASFLFLYARNNTYRRTISEL